MESNKRNSVKAARLFERNFFEKLFKKGLTNHPVCYIIALALLSESVVKKPQKFSI